MDTIPATINPTEKPGEGGPARRKRTRKKTLSTVKKQLQVFLKDSLWYSIKPVFTKLFNFLLVPLYTGYLTPEEYGDLQFVIAFGMVFRILAGMGLSSSFWKFRTEASGYSKADAALNMVVFQIFIGVSVFLLVLLVKIFFFRQSFIVLLIVIFILAQTFKMVFDKVQIIQRANHHSKMFILAIITQSILFFLLNILFLMVLDMNIKGVIYSYLIGYSLAVFIFLRVILREAKGGRINLPLTREMLRYGIPLMIGNIGAYVITLSDRFFLKAMSSSAELGYYSYGYKYGDLVNSLLIGTFFLAWNPMRWDIYEMKNSKTVFAQFNRTLFMAIPFMGMLVMSGALVLAGLLTVDKEYLEGIRIIYFIGFSYVLYGLYYFNTMGMLFTEKTGKISQLVLISAVINIILNFILIPLYGMTGAAIATISGYLAMFIQGRIYCQIYYPIERNTLFEITQMVLIFAVLIVMTWMSYHVKSIYAIALITLGLSFVFPGLNFMMGFVSRKEVQLLADLVKNARKNAGKSKKKRDVADD
jgi:O-antigen/teichoic acid export membrane protein